jgi:hypothetical protein
MSKGQANSSVRLQIHRQLHAQLRRLLFVIRLWLSRQTCCPPGSSRLSTTSPLPSVGRISLRRGVVPLFLYSPPTSAEFITSIYCIVSARPVSYGQTGPAPSYEVDRLHISPDCCVDTSVFLFYLTLVSVFPILRQLSEFMFDWQRTCRNGIDGHRDRC